MVKFVVDSRPVATLGKTPVAKGRAQSQNCIWKRSASRPENSNMLQNTGFLLACDVARHAVAAGQLVADTLAVNALDVMNDGLDVMNKVAADKAFTNV